MSYYVTMNSTVQLSLEPFQIEYITKDKITNELPFILGLHVKKPKSLKDKYPYNNPNKLEDHVHLVSEVDMEESLVTINIQGSYPADNSEPYNLSQWYRSLVKALDRVYGSLCRDIVTGYHFEAECMGIISRLDYSFKEVYDESGYVYRDN